MNDEKRLYVGPNDMGEVPDFISDELQDAADSDGYVPIDNIKNDGNGVLILK